MYIKNPILKGFNPDPSILRVDDDYYIAVSTFEWSPGVVIHHSKDLKNWHQIARPLNSTYFIDMKGNPDSGGVWAPDLSYSDGKFWLVYSDVKVVNGPWKDVTNYLITADEIDGEWSEPIALNYSGFDASLFHDIDGRKWFLNMIWDHRVNRHNFNGIALQEYDPVQKKLIDEPRNIFKGTDIKLVEAPHLYRINDYYYLFTAEGGTLFNHQETVARSKCIEGPYEVHPDNPFISSFYRPNITLQRAGHGSLVETPDHEWYFAHLTSRPLPTDTESILDNRGYSPLGRETAIQKVTWKNDWPYIVGGNFPQDEVEMPIVEETIWPDDFPIIDDFNETTLNHQWNTVRNPFDEKMGSLSVNPSHLRLYGQGSFHNHFANSFVARRWQSLNFEAETKVISNPTTFQQQAGLVAYYNTNNWTSIHLTWDPDQGKVVDLLECDRRTLLQPLKNSIKVPENINYVYFKINVNRDKYFYSYSFNGKEWKKIDIIFDSRKLSDEYVQEGGFFTGAFIGLSCIDTASRTLVADFDYFRYEELD
ncbi:glycoside hydrolase family 43 protein [Fundicoccus culcitae]|uniref:Glycoside hydrolase family 43 protein n=1 Tax=Fundicoccus culcitae TaxID=2969821 RepID=A0ABY5PA06_9LACT|nr:glycoside hydrolase family 43 protein [Fundicoccus culcitae]UUX35369.1 glycoside hydrolase family 43 protein [Fundicoccus culcitae]